MPFLQKGCDVPHFETERASFREKIPQIFTLISFSIKKKFAIWTDMNYKKQK